MSTTSLGWPYSMSRILKILSQAPSVASSAMDRCLQASQADPMRAPSSLGARLLASARVG